MHGNPVAKAVFQGAGTKIWNLIFTSTFVDLQKITNNLITNFGESKENTRVNGRPICNCVRNNFVSF